MTQHFVIVGGGQAAAQAAASLRQGGYTGRLSLVGAEALLPYQRPPLSKKYLAGEIAAERLSIRPQTFYEQHGIELLLGVALAGLDAAAQCAVLADGRPLAYVGLLLATGSRVRRLRVPGADLPGVHYLRSRADADGLGAALAGAGRLVIIGGGYIGLEVAAVARQRGRDVTVLEAASRVMGRVVAPEVSAFYHAYHSAAGVQIHCGRQIDRLAGTDRVEAVVTRDGSEFPADAVLVAIGIEPETTLAERSGIRCENGIVVDEYAATNVAGIFAAGDCTSLPSALYGRRVRLESVHNAIEQAKTAAASMLGQPRAYADVPWFWSDQYDLKLQIAGLSDGYDQAIRLGPPESRCYSVAYLREGRLIALDAINDPRAFLAAKKLIWARTTFTREQLGEPGFNLTGFAANLP
jgi:3-phenylpropionate/trans-cinnamate dioxygenase ferredoxin reductase subunit